MKPGQFKPRTTRMKTRKCDLRPTKPIKKRNPERQAKRRKCYQAFLGSPAWKVLRAAALDLAGYRCQGEHTHGMTTVRCGETDRLTVHHQTYARFGGREQPEDLLVLCRDCHNRLHAMEGKHVG